MSTRGWYEYHVLNAGIRKRSLAMQFYKWGDATPENALQEWNRLNGKIQSNDGLMPVVWLDDLLREQLGELYSRLPENFSVAAFLFLIQRAYEEDYPYRRLACHDLDKLDSPDYRLGFAIGKAMAVNGFQPQEHADRILNAVLAFIGAGHFVRPWKEYGLTWTVLTWLQYLTQTTLARDMGSIAGATAPPLDISYRYRFFIWIEPTECFRITRLAVELCHHDGTSVRTKEQDVIADPNPRHPYEREQAAKLQRQIGEYGVDLCRLDELCTEFEPVPDHFWGPQCHERPPLTEAARGKIFG